MDLFAEYLYTVRINLKVNCFSYNNHVKFQLSGRNKAEAVVVNLENLSCNVRWIQRWFPAMVTVRCLTLFSQRLFSTEEYNEVPLIHICMYKGCLRILNDFKVYSIHLWKPIKTSIRHQGISANVFLLEEQVIVHLETASKAWLVSIFRSNWKLVADCLILYFHCFSFSWNKLFVKLVHSHPLD